MSIWKKGFRMVEILIWATDDEAERGSLIVVPALDGDFADLLV